MAAVRRPTPMVYLPALRGVVAVWLMVAYVLAGALHGICDLDVTNPAGKSEIASVLDGKTGHSEQKGGVSAHHCHGCFFVAVPQAPRAEANVELAWSPAWPPSTERAGLMPDTEAPPPKHLT